MPPLKRSMEGYFYYLYIIMCMFDNFDKFSNFYFFSILAFYLSELQYSFAHILFSFTTILDFIIVVVIELLQVYALSTHCMFSLIIFLYFIKSAPRILEVCAFTSGLMPHTLGPFASRFQSRIQLEKILCTSIVGVRLLTLLPTISCS